MCAFPIVWSKEVVGVIVLGFAETLVLDVDTSTRARNLGDRLGVAFATAAKDEQLYYQANYDTLTGLPNRHHFKDRLAQVLVQAHREQPGARRGRRGAATNRGAPEALYARVRLDCEVGWR